MNCKNKRGCIEKKDVLLYVSQRVDFYPEIGERRDALDGRWYKLLDKECFRVLPVPNDKAQIKYWLDSCPPSGILLSGGNTPSTYGGGVPERCATDEILLDYSVANKIPVLGVCRGMQSIAIHFGGSLKKVEGHVRARHELSGQIIKSVNSFHEYAVDFLPEGFSVMAYAEDGVIEAVRHKFLSITGIMWHPEREEEFCGMDLKLINELFACERASGG